MFLKQYTIEGKRIPIYQFSNTFFYPLSNFIKKNTILNNVSLFFLLFCLYLRISVKTDLHSGKAVSRLYIANANRHDSGNYTCAIGDFAKVTVAVHVLNGKLSFFLVRFDVV